MREQTVFWQSDEKPAVNTWYNAKDGYRDFLKIRKDFHDEEAHITYYQVVSYYDGETRATGLTLAQAREYMRENSYKGVII